MENTKEKLTKSIWWEGSNEIDCNIQQIKLAFENYGEIMSGVTSLMLGLTSIDIVEQGSDFVTIKTNEGIMKRTNISKHITVLSDVKASGFLGFFYRKFGKSNIGNAILKSYKTYFEKQI
ncbi:MAG: hypothetical protein ACXAC6_02895 [Candidatus Hodarchaeales archaeon]|jgi:hypothetical protein